MPSIGETLREARMRQRLDITDVEGRTKIRAKYLRALENEDFGMLPGSTFVKSFLRTYAEFLGLDPHLLVEEYRARHEPVTEAELTPFAQPRPSHGRDRRRPPRRVGPLFGIAAFIFGVLVLLLVLGLTSGSDEKAKRSDNPSTTAQRTSAQKTTTSRRKKTSKRRRRRTPTVVRMRISPQAPTYACIDDAHGKVLYEGTLTKPRSFRSKRVRLNLGRRVVRLTVNGKRVRIPPGSDPIGYSFTPRSVKTLPLGQRPCA